MSRDSEAPKTGILAHMVDQIPLFTVYMLVTSMSAVFMAIYIMVKRRRARLYKRDVIHQARELIIEGIQDAVIVLGPDKRIMDANFLAKQLLKLPLIDMPVLPLKEVNPELYEQLDFNGGSSQIQLYVKDEERYYDTRISRLKSWNTFFNTSIIVLRDITEIRRYSGHLEHLVEERTRQLRNTERLATIGETAAMVGHDLRNPLQVIVGTIFFLKKQLKSIGSEEEWEEVEKMIGTIHKEADYMNKIVSDLHDYAKVFNVDLEDLDVKAMIEETTNRIEMPGINLQVQIPEDLPPIQADKIMITRVFTNIVTNAVQAMPEGGKLWIKAKVKGEMVHIDVIDTGVGIPPENMDQLFVPLFTTKPKGTGFGLSVCKRFVEGHGGHIKVRSKEGKGATFTVILPFYPTEAVVV
jgi:signal transduction histidine kinase